MRSFPAVSELLAFLGCLAAMGLVLRLFHHIEPAVYRILNTVIARVWPSIHFPRSLLDARVKTLPPLRRKRVIRIVQRYKFTLFMLFLNIYTFVFTNDFKSGEINTEILESLGFSYAHFAQHRWFILVTSNFIHFHLLHLSVNMLMLVLFSGSLELLMGTRFAAIVYFVSMNANVPNGLFLLPSLRVLYPQFWRETVQYVDVGASIGILGSLGGLARILRPGPRYAILGVSVLGAVVGAVYIHNLFGLDHAVSALIGYFMAHVLLTQAPPAKVRHPLYKNA